MFVDALQSHHVLILRPVTAVFQPQALVHRLQGLVRLLFII